MPLAKKLKAYLLYTSFMSVETQNQLVGAAISLFSALLVFVLTSFNQWQKDERDRNRLLEDRRFQRRLDTLTLRLGEVQKYLDAQAGVISILFEIEYKLVNLGLIFNYVAATDELTKLYRETNNTNSRILNLGDSDLLQMNIALTQILITEQEEVLRLRKKVVGEEPFDKSPEEVRASKFYQDASKIHNSMLKRIDELSGLN